MSAASTAHGADPDLDKELGSTLQLGNDYEKKKQKLLQELQLDYRTYIAKQNNQKTCEPHVHQQGLSLPINERASIKERLREERRKEYNIFLQEQAQNRRLKRETPPISSKPEPFQASPSQGSPLPFLNTQTNTPPPHKERPVSRTDAATLTETGHGRRHKDTWNHGTGRRRRWQIHKSEELHEEELSSDEEENLDFRHRRKQDRCTQAPEYKEKKRTRRHRGNRAFHNLTDAEAPAPHDQNNNDGILTSASEETPDGMRTAVRSTSVTRKDEAELTGLMIGTAEEQTVTQMKKEQYKQELLKQIAEQQRNKIKEKRLELKVAATGATDPEKQPERIKQFGVAHQQYEDVRRDASHRSGINLEAVRRDTNKRHEDNNPLENTHYRNPRGNSQEDFSTELSSQQPGKMAPGPGMGNAPDVPSFDFPNEDYHRDFMRMPGGAAFPRDAPPIIPDTHQAPHGAAHHYNKTRSPLDLAQNQTNLLGGTQQSHIPPPVRADEAPPFATEGLRVGKQRRESVLSYQEALKQQIKEKEEKKRREKEEKERADAKLEAAMLACDPWGRGGGGAPIKDQNGNLVSDLKQMHRINNDRTPAAKEAEPPLSHQRSADSSYRPPSQQLSTKYRYKEELNQQIEEKKRKQAEEQEQIRIAEEKEEERLVKERARILQAYEEEQRKKAAAESNPQKRIHGAKTHPRVEAKRANNHSAQEREKITSQPAYQRQQREPSPPVPTLQKKLVAPKPDVNQPSRTERSVSAPHAQPVPTTVPTPNDDQQEVVKRLSALRNYLRKEQKQMQLQMDRTETSRSHLDRRQPRMDAFEFVIMDGVQSSAACGGAENQNQRRSNQFKHRGGEIYQQGATRPLDEQWERTASQRKQVYEEDADSIDRRERNDQLDDRSLKLWRARATDQNTRQPSELADYNRTEGMSGDQVPSSHSTQRRPVSMETTEPWLLHPGTSETVKHTTHRRKLNSRLDALPWLTQQIT